ncbi:MAG: D-hexose-6-phosphate mutarotase [Verrucomicrobia bacterium]|nr:D-hexose-6-phosphate mutarotase [Verrucomicrobiota bacterium]
MSIDDLKRFEIPGRVSVLEGNGGLPKLEVTTDASSAEIYLHGAHVTDFKKRGEPSLLFTSQCSRFEAGHPIRGGVPIIFPWFGARDGEGAHGFARNVSWLLQETTSTPHVGVSLRFAFPGARQSALWPSFSAYYNVIVTDKLTLELVLTNTAPGQNLTLENCLHTYFTVGDISAVSVHGLKGVNYLDKVDGFAPKTEVNDAIRVSSEVDRVYLDAPATAEIRDTNLGRKILVEKSGGAATVVWNPWIAKSQQLSDFGNEEYLRMICVESGNVAAHKVTLAPGESTVLRVDLSSTRL